MTKDEISIVLESLRPIREGKIMDMVEAAGIDVSPWSIKSDGSAVSNPRANPHFCYEWAFGGDGEPTALCIWHPSLSIKENQIVCDENLRLLALELDRLAIDKTNPPHVRSRSRDQAKRARNFDLLLQRAFRKSEAIRVIVLMGNDDGKDKLGWDTSIVRYRSLDTDPWFVHHYDYENGSFRLVRSVPVATPEDSEMHDTESPKFVDQFEIPEPEEKLTSKGFSYSRAREVRQEVLLRAGGVCECCGTQGFKMTSGAVYLETHHVIPLSEGGPDVVWNVVAVCPNDHRIAHYGETSSDLQRQLIRLLDKIHPGAEKSLLALIKPVEV